MTESDYAAFDAEYEREAREADELLERLQRRRTEQAEPTGVLVFKTYERQPEAEPAMTTDDDIQRRLEMLASIIGGEVGRTQTEIMQTLRAEIAQLGAEVRAEVRAALAIKALMPSRGRDVA